MTAEARGLAGGMGGRREATKFLHTTHGFKLLHNTYFKRSGGAEQHTAVMLQISTCTPDVGALRHFVASAVIWMGTARSAVVSSTSNRANTALHTINAFSHCARIAKLLLNSIILGSQGLYCNRIPSK
jgi:hypothetical protein